MGQMVLMERRAGHTDQPNQAEDRGYREGMEWAGAVGEVPPAVQIAALQPKTRLSKQRDLSATSNLQEMKQTVKVTEKLSGEVQQEYDLGIASTFQVDKRESSKRVSAKEG